MWVVPPPTAHPSLTFWFWTASNRHLCAGPRWGWIDRADPPPSRSSKSILLPWNPTMVNPPLIGCHGVPELPASIFIYSVLQNCGVRGLNRTHHQIFRSLLSLAKHPHTRPQTCPHHLGKFAARTQTTSLLSRSESQDGCDVEHGRSQNELSCSLPR